MSKVVCLYCPECNHGQDYPVCKPPEFEKMTCGGCGASIYVWDWLFWPRFVDFFNGVKKTRTMKQ